MVNLSRAVDPRVRRPTDAVPCHEGVCSPSASGRLVSEPAGAVVREVLEILAR